MSNTFLEILRHIYLAIPGMIEEVIISIDLSDRFDGLAIVKMRRPYSQSFDERIRIGFI